MKLVVIVAAGGKGKRFSAPASKRGVGMPGCPGRKRNGKLFAKVAGRPLLYYTLKALEKARSVSSIIVVIEQRSIKCALRLVRDAGFKKVAAVVGGGRTRYESVRRGLAILPESAGYIAIHDGARPLVTGDVIKRSFAAAKKYGAAITAVPEKNTVKESDRRGMIRSTPGRDRLWEAQTPQVFRRDIIAEAYRRCRGGAGVTDDAMAVERLGIKVKLVKGDYSNIKVTTRQDLAVVKALLGCR